MKASPFTTDAALRPDGTAGPARARLEPWQDHATPERRTAWQALADAASTPNPFFEPWYLVPALEAMNRDGSAQLLTVRLAGELIGLMPIARMGRYGRWPIPHLAAWLHPNAFLGAPLVRAGCESAFWQAMLDWADTAPAARRTLFLHLPAMPLEQPLTQALLDLAQDRGRKAGLVMRQQRALLHSPLPPDLYLERALAGKKRKELRRQHARLAEQGVLSFERRHDADAVEEWTETFLDLERRGWKGRNGSAMACAPETAHLFRHALGTAATLGRLERLSLSLDGRPVAMLANFITPPGSFSYKTAYDEDLARFSPGVLLQRENLALLARPEIGWCDSCAAPDHPMIDSLWTERRPIGRISIAIGGTLRRSVFAALLALELGRNPAGLAR